MRTILKNFSFQPLITNSVRMTLGKLNVRKATGYDYISPKILRLAASGIADCLFTKLFNECIRKSEWPQARKKGEWYPVYKKDHWTDVRNYRPITFFSVDDKVFESMMSSQVANYIDCMFNPCISADRKNHSCKTTLLALTENWKQALGSNKNI